MKRWVNLIFTGIFIGLLAFTAILFLAQHKLIWFPRPYGPTYNLRLPQTAVELPFTTGQGKQLAFYLPPSAAAQPERLWLLYCGNASLALDWTDFIARDPNPRDGFLLVDYPGFGRCEGSAEPANIGESTEEALRTLAEHLRLTPQELDARCNVLAHSIGTGAALQFAVRHPVRRVILLAPFTSLRDMARRIVGSPLCWILRHDFDNRARLAELAARERPPHVIIFHGGEDETIPVQMGRSLGAMFPKITSFREVPEANHDTIVHEASAAIYSAMNEKSQ